jgi:hypothetical protein
MKKCALTAFVVLGMRSIGNDTNKRRTTIWLLLRDIAPTHRSVLVKDFLTNNNMTTLEHPPYSPDRFPRLKSAMKGRRVCDATDIIKNATEEPKRTSQHGFQECFQQLYRQWRKYIFIRELFWKKCSLNDRTVLYFSEIKWYQEHLKRQRKIWWFNYFGQHRRRTQARKVSLVIEKNSINFSPHFSVTLDSFFLSVGLQQRFSCRTSNVTDEKWIKWEECRSGLTVALHPPNCSSGNLTPFFSTPQWHR